MASARYNRKRTQRRRIVAALIIGVAIGATLATEVEMWTYLSGARWWVLGSPSCPVAVVAERANGWRAQKGGVAMDFDSLEAAKAWASDVH